MYFIFLTLFSASLLGIVFMIGRKWVFIQKGQVFEAEKEMSESEYWEELQRAAKEGLRKFGFVMLVIIIRIYVKIVTFLKKVFLAGVGRIDALYGRMTIQEGTGPVEPNKFLKKMGEYKKKVKRIKDRVRREEES